MGFLPQCNSTLEYLPITEDPVVGSWNIHKLGKYIGAVFALLAVVQSLLLIVLHATHYSKPWEQRHIIRILFMVPMYATVSWLSYTYYQHGIYFEVVRDCYEAFAIAAFFTLMCHYLAPDLHEQKEYFRTIKPRPWILPISWLKKVWGGDQGIWRTPRSGLTWFNVIWSGVFQYCFIRVFMTCVAVATQAFGRYCQESLSPMFSHVWVMVIEAIAVTIAMYCIIQFYLQVKGDIAVHKPLLKVLAIKLVIFLSFWQTIAISFFTSTGLVKPSKTFQTPDIRVGIPNFLLCVEMAFFALFHFWAFSWRPYSITSPEFLSESVPGEDIASESYKGGPLGIKAMAEAFNPWDMIKAIGRAAKWLFVGRKTRQLDRSYAVPRVATDSTLNVDQTGLGGNKLESLRTEYGGPGSLHPSSGGGKPLRYPRNGNDEGEGLIANAQSFPISGPPGARDHSPSYLTYTDTRTTESDIGVAKSIYEGDDSSWERTEQYTREPERPGRGQYGYRPGGQETGVTRAPYPDRQGEQVPGFDSRAPTLVFSGPPIDQDAQGRRWRG